jgi:hypothetical protein
MKRLLTTAAICLLAGHATAQDFDLDALVAAAKAEPPTTVYAVTGKIVDTATAFNEKYGLNVTGKKVNEAGQVDLLIREHQAGAVTGDRVGPDPQGRGRKLGAGRHRPASGRRRHGPAGRGQRPACLGLQFRGV